MSIDKKSRRWGEYHNGVFLDFEDSEYYLVCDICGKRIAFEEWENAVAYKKKNGWESRKQSDEWIDICKECLE